jgi:hypothetical protein
MLHDPDETRIAFAGPRPAAAEGLVTVPIDFGHLFSLIPLVGRNAALLYVTLRALRQAGTGALTLDDLAWKLRAHPWRVRRWMHQLEKQRLIVSRRAHGSFADILLLEVPERRPVRIEHEVPVHWFEHVLPLHPRSRFFLYLYIRSHEWGGSVASLSRQRIQRVLLLSPAHVRWHLWHLHRAGLVVQDRGEYVVRDPAPLSVIDQRALQLRQLRVLGWPLARICIALAVAIACVLFLLY